MVLGGRALPAAYAALVDERAAPGARCSTSPGRAALPPPDARGRPRASSCPAPRPRSSSTSPSPRSTGSLAPTAPRPVRVVDLCSGSGRDRARGQGRAPGRRRCAASSCRRDALRLGGRQPSTDSASTSTSCRATRRGRASRTGRRRRRRDGQPALHPRRGRAASTPRSATTTPSSRSTAAARTGWPSRSPSPRGRGRLLRPGGLRRSIEHADTQGESLPAASRRPGQWIDVSDHARPHRPPARHRGAPRADPPVGPRPDGSTAHH